MIPYVPIETTTTGGSAVVVALALLGVALTAVLSFVVAYRVIRGYRRNRSRARLYLALGLVLLTTVPVLLGFVLTPPITGVSAVGRTVTTTVSKLLGLAAMLYAIYGPTRKRTAQRGDSPEQVDNE